VAVKRVKKKSSAVKDDDLDMDKIDDVGKDNLQLEDSDRKLSEVGKKESSVVIVYKTYDADVEFKLKEIPSKNN